MTVSLTCFADDKVHVVEGYGDLFNAAKSPNIEPVKEGINVKETTREGNHPGKYPQQQIHKDGKSYTGSVFAVDNEGNVRGVLCLKDGFCHGDCISWHPDGSVDEIQGFKEGLPDGFFKKWWSDGTPNHIINFIDGKHLGYRFWYKNGLPRSIFNIKRGKPNGLHAMYYSNGKPCRKVTFVEGVIRGGDKWFSRDGKLLFTVKYKINKAGVQQYDAAYRDDGSTIPEEEALKIKDKCVKLHFRDIRLSKINIFEE